MEIMVRLRSREALQDYLTFYKIKTGYALAKKAGILPGTATFLVRGHRETCSTRTARAIEAALACPPGFLFEATASGVVDPPRSGGVRPPSGASRDDGLGE